jgi:chromate transporter
VTFLPSFLFVLVGGPFVESLRRQPMLQAALSAITAAVVGVVLNLSVWFATHTIFRQSTQFSVGRLRVEAPVLHSVEPMALAIAIAALVATLRFKVGIGWVLAGSTLLGALYWFIH